MMDNAMLANLYQRISTIEFEMRTLLRDLDRAMEEMHGTTKRDEYRNDRDGTAGPYRGDGTGYGYRIVNR